MTQHIRDHTVADAIASTVGVDATPELFLGNVVHPVVPLDERPPLLSSGYLSGITGVIVGAVALNTSHAGLFSGSLPDTSILRVNWITIFNAAGAAALYTVRRLDVVAGFTAAAVVPAYISAAAPVTNRVHSLTKSDTVAAVGTEMAVVRVETGGKLTIRNPFIINRGALLVAHATVNTALHVSFGWEAFNAIRGQ